MEGIIAIIGIIIAIVNAVNKGKQVKKNAPGQAPRPQQQRTSQPASEQRPRYEPVQPTVSTVSATPTQPAVRELDDDFWKKVFREAAMQDEREEQRTDAGHEQVKNMSEGSSRECAHGSVGGSMAYESHQGGMPVAEKAKRRQFEESKAEEYSMYRPAMNAREMRQAVVMAEILKRPQDRMAEQARRWSLK